MACAQALRYVLGMEDGVRSSEASGSAAPDMLTPRQLATRWSLAVHTLENWRSAGRGPAHLKFGRSVRYRLSDVMRYENEALKPGGESGNAPAEAG